MSLNICANVVNFNPMEVRCDCPKEFRLSSIVQMFACPELSSWPTFGAKAGHPKTYHLFFFADERNCGLLFKCKILICTCGFTKYGLKQIMFSVLMLRQILHFSGHMLYSSYITSMLIVFHHIHAKCLLSHDFYFVEDLARLCIANQVFRHAPNTYTSLLS